MLSRVDSINPHCELSAVYYGIRHNIISALRGKASNGQTLENIDREIVLLCAAARDELTLIPPSNTVVLFGVDNVRDIIKAIEHDLLNGDSEEIL